MIKTTFNWIKGASKLIYRKVTRYRNVFWGSLYIFMIVYVVCVLVTKTPLPDGLQLTFHKMKLYEKRTENEETVYLYKEVISSDHYEKKDSPHEKQYPEKINEITQHPALKLVGRKRAKCKTKLRNHNHTKKGLEDIFRHQKNEISILSLKDTDQQNKQDFNYAKSNVVKDGARSYGYKIMGKSENKSKTMGLRAQYVLNTRFQNKTKGLMLSPNTLTRGKVYADPTPGYIYSTKHLKKQKVNIRQPKAEKTNNTNIRMTVEEPQRRSNTTITTSKYIELATDFVENDTDNCTFVKHPYFPLCLDQLTKLKKELKNHTCFMKQDQSNVTNHTNITQCAMYNYLTQVEPYCMGERALYERTHSNVSSLNFHLKGLLDILDGEIYNWMKRRITFLWSTWIEGGRQFSLVRKRYQKKQVVVFAYALKVWEHLLTRAGTGTPLGELIQWSDLLTALYILGYDIHFARTELQLLRILKPTKTECVSGQTDTLIDVIYTDLVGILVMEKLLGERTYTKYRCMVRVLDSFGTYPEFNYPDYPGKIPQGRSGFWGDKNLIPTQFLTFFPHTHDNNFLGFVLPRTSLIRNGSIFNPKNTTSANETNINNNTSSKKPMALLYAKHPSYITKENERYLQIVSEYFDIHATAAGNVPKYIHRNHGPVTTKQIQQLLSTSKLFIGVGFPYEGPGPLEAMAHGVPYIQPKFAIPKSKLNDGFWAGKPTLRKLTSQNPYMEEFVGEPYCFTIDVTNELLLRNTLEEIKNMKSLKCKIPKEFTTEGFIERVHVFTEYMDYCNPYSPRWPPVAHLQIYLSKPGQSCKDTCMAKGLVCERTYFDDINKKHVIEKHSSKQCSVVTVAMVLHAPSMDHVTRTCYVQAHAQLFSCMHVEEHVIRVCPCRDYEMEQSAICKNCL